MCVIITSESTCAQGRSRSSQSEPRIRLLTPWQRRSLRVPSVSTAKPYVASNPRCPSEGVWDILHNGTHVTAVLESRIVFSVRIVSPVFSRYSLWYFYVMDFHVTWFQCTEPVGPQTLMYPELNVSNLRTNCLELSPQQTLLLVERRAHLSILPDQRTWWYPEF